MKNTLLETGGEMEATNQMMLSHKINHDNHTSFKIITLFIFYLTLYSNDFAIHILPLLMVLFFHVCLGKIISCRFQHNVLNHSIQHLQ